MIAIMTDVYKEDSFFSECRYRIVSMDSNNKNLKLKDTFQAVLILPTHRTEAFTLFTD